MGLLDEFGAWLDQKKRNIAANVPEPGLLWTRMNEDARAYQQDWRQDMADEKSVMPEIRQQGQKFATDKALELGGLLGTFAGVGAKTADALKLSKAKDMVKAGADPVQVWKETGWTDQFPDGKWRFEIPDNESVALPIRNASLDDLNRGNTTVDALSDVFSHQQLGNAYPGTTQGFDANNSRLIARIRPGGGESASYADGVITVGDVTSLEGGKRIQRSPALHEIQHYVQDTENFARGGSPQEFSIPTGKVAAEIDSINERLSALAKERDALRQKPVGTPTAADHKRWRESEQEYNDLLDKRLKMVKEATANPFKQYQSLAGEAEARLTQSRMNLTPAERTARPPWLEFDVPREQQIVRGLLGEPTGPAMWTAYHGSPHKFDKFDLSKIGTGEGAQAYGHGLYFADNPGVAKQYAQNLGPDAAINNIDAFLRQHYGIKRTEQEVADRLRKFPGLEGLADNTKAVTAIKDLLPDYRPNLAIVNTKDLNNYRALNAEVEKSAPQNVYKVDISDAKAPQDAFLQWDKPLSEQPKVLKKLRKGNYAPVDDPSITGEQFHKALQYEMGGNADEIASLLRADGIPGIRYLDGGSRGAGSGTMNTVLFDDSLVKILERNGVPVTGLLGQ